MSQIRDGQGVAQGPDYGLNGASIAEQSGQPEPPVARVLRSKAFGGGPVTAVVELNRSAEESVG